MLSEAWFWPYPSPSIHKWMKKMWYFTSQKGILSFAVTRINPWEVPFEITHEVGSYNTLPSMLWYFPFLPSSYSYSPRQFCFTFHVKCTYMLSCTKTMTYKSKKACNICFISENNLIYLIILSSVFSILQQTIQLHPFIMTWNYYIVYMHHIFFIQSFVDGPKFVS